MPFHHNICNRDFLGQAEREAAQLIAHLLDELASANNKLEALNHTTAHTMVSDLYDTLIDSATTKLGYDIRLP